MSSLVKAEQTPIAVTGYTQNMILGVGESYSGSLTATMDNGTSLGGNAWYAVGQDSNAPATGLPAGTTVTSQSDSSTTFAIQPAGGNNALLIDYDDQSGSFTLTNPAEYSTLSFFGSSGNGANTVDYTLNFSNGTLQTGSVSFDDWFGGSNVAYDANGRIDQNGHNNENAGNPNIYQYNISVTDPGSALTSIDFTQDPSSGSGSNPFENGHTAIFAVSGAVVVPLPAGVIEGLVLMGATGLLSLRRRRLSESL